MTCMSMYKSTEISIPVKVDSQSISVLPSDAVHPPNHDSPPPSVQVIETETRCFVLIGHVHPDLLSHTFTQVEGKCPWSCLFT